MAISNSADCHVASLLAMTGWWGVNIKVALYQRYAKTNVLVSECIDIYRICPHIYLITDLISARNCFIYA